MLVEEPGGGPGGRLSTDLSNDLSTDLSTGLSVDMSTGLSVDMSTGMPTTITVATVFPSKVPDVDPEVVAKRRRDHRRSLWRQFLACASVQAVHFMTGVCMAYSSSLIPALEGPASDIPVTRHQSAWLASSFVMAVPLGSFMYAVLGNVMGRVSFLRFMAVPFCAGWAIIACANCFELLVLGRVLTGLAIGISHSPSLLFITEVASKRIRGGLGAVSTSMASFAIVLTYVLGAYLPWRLHAWVNCVAPVIPIGLQCAFSTESPVWLRAKGRAEAAAKASAFYYNDPDVVLSAPSAGAKAGKAGEGALERQCRLLFTDPLGYKPLIIIFTVFLIQQLVGVYITIYYAVTFFTETGSTIDPYMASILIGVVRMVFCTAVALVMTRFGRRTLMTVSSAGQAVAMAVSGYATLCILREPGSVSSLWVVAGLLGYIALGCLGWQTVPWSMMVELFPHEVRSLASPVTSSIAHILMFAVLQLYPTLAELVGGSVGVQFVFAGTSALSAVFVLVFLPETRGRTLAEIEDYFRHNVTFLTERRRRRAERREAARAALAANKTAA